jgi:hypothetical protein
MQNRSDEHTEKQGLRCSIADTPEARDQVYRLRYAGYFRKGSIDASEDERFSDRFDATPNHFSFLVRGAEEEAVATVRISVVRQDLGWVESPGGTVFGDLPAYRTLAAEGFVEASRLVFAPQARRDALMQLLGYMAAMADFYEAEWLSPARAWSIPPCTSGCSDSARWPTPDLTTG